LRTWGQPGQGSEPYGFFGPRDIAVGNDGLVYISDTGNNRIGVYTPEGQFVAQIGGKGNQPGQFDEPVGIAFSADGDLFVADEGNQRVQVLAVGQTGSLQAKGSWSVDAWPHNEMLYKPYLTVVGDRVYITDTESGSILEYTAAGLHLMTYDLNSTGYLNYGLVYGIDAQPDGVLWVSDLAGGAAVLVRIVPAP
jgi:DNA-binding beta-propeller fold protein YncE